MEEPFYAERLARHGISVVTPSAKDRAMVDRVIFDELTQGRVDDESRREYVETVARLALDGAESVVLACTEIEMLLDTQDTSVPLVDSMRVHALAAVDAALEFAPIKNPE